MSSRPSLRSQLNQIRLWVRQGRTDAWIAHRLDIPVDQLAQFKRDHKLNGENERSERATVAEPQHDPEPPGPSLEDEPEDEPDEVPEQAEEEPEDEPDEVRAAEEELEDEPEDDREQADEEPEDVLDGLAEEEDESPEQPGDQPADDVDVLSEPVPAEVAEEDAEAVEPRGRDEEDDGERPSRRRRRGRRGGRRRRSTSTETVYEATFEHGGEGYGLWLDPAVAESDAYLRHWAGHRAVTVTIKGEEIVIRRAGGKEETEPKPEKERAPRRAEPERSPRRGSRRRSSSRRSSEPPPSAGTGGPASWLPE